MQKSSQSITKLNVVLNQCTLVMAVMAGVELTWQQKRHLPGHVLHQPTSSGQYTVAIPLQPMWLERQIRSVIQRAMQLCIKTRNKPIYMSKSVGLQCFDAVGWVTGRASRLPPVKNWVVGCWRGYLCGARCRLAYGPVDATVTHCLLLQ